MTYQKRKYWEILFPGRDISNGNKTHTNTKRKSLFWNPDTLLWCFDWWTFSSWPIVLGLVKMSPKWVDTISVLHSEQQNHLSFFTKQKWIQCKTQAQDASFWGRPRWTQRVTDGWNSLTPPDVVQLEWPSCHPAKQWEGSPDLTMLRTQ